MVETVGIYSRGAHAVVRPLSDDETIHFPGAQLAREEFARNRVEAVKLFYRHVIASALFPDNFVEVTGVSTVQTLD